MRTADKNHVARVVFLLILVVTIVVGVRITTASEHVPLEQGIRDNAFCVDRRRRDAFVRVVCTAKGGGPPLLRPAAVRNGVTSRRNPRPGPGSVTFAVDLLLVS